MASISIIKEKDIFQFATKLSLILVVLLLTNFFRLSTLALLISIGSNAYLLHFSFKILNELKSDFVKPFWVAVLLSLLGEFFILFDLNYTNSSWSFWLFTILHLIRDLIISLKLLHNILKSNIYNYFWVRVLPVTCVGLLFLLLQIFLFGREQNNSFVLLLHNAASCLALLLAGLRNNHTSYSGFFIMILGVLTLVISDIFYYTKIIGSSDQPISFDFRTAFLLVGDTLMLFAAYDHVAEFEKESRKKSYYNFIGEEMSKTKTKSSNAQFQKLQEPLI